MTTIEKSKLPPFSKGVAPTKEGSGDCNQACSQSGEYNPPPRLRLGTPFEKGGFRQRRSRTIVTTLLLAILNILPNQAHTQCGNPTLNTWADTWQSCQPSPSPHPNHAPGHWILYDLGEIYQLSTAHIWNTNEPTQLGNGFRQVTVDYSPDGALWTQLGEYEFPQGTGDPVYGGFPGFDFEGREARYVLITARSNWGHPTCAGLAEVKFNLWPRIPLEEDEHDPPNTDILQFDLFPNPTDNHVNIRITSTQEDAFEIRLSNSLGQRVYHNPLFLVEGENSLSIALDDFVSGIYWVSVTSLGNGERSVRTLVVVK